MKMMRSVMLIAVVIMAAVAAGAGTPYTWTNTAGGFWSTGGNWSPNGTPGAVAGDSVYPQCQVAR